MAEAIKILIIEDDLHTRDILAKIITRDLGLRVFRPLVLLAADGAEGVELFKKHLPQLVITDLLLPRLDGFKVVETIRSHPAGKAVTILVTSAIFRDRSSLAKLQQTHDVHFQPKPFSPKVLLARVHELLGALQPEEKKSAPGAVRSPAPPSATVRSPAPDLLEAVLGAEASELAGQPSASALSAAPAAAASPTEQPALPAPPPAAPPAAAAPPQATAPPPSPAPTAGKPAPAPLFRGELAEHPLGEVLLDLFDTQQFGLLDLWRGKVHKRLFVMAGHPIFVQSNVRSETLGQMLVRRGGLTPEQHSKTLQRSEAQGIKYGEALVQAGLLDEGQVMQELLAQTRLKIETCLRWAEGTFAFTEDPAVGSRVPHCVLDPVTLVLEGLKRYPDLDASFRKLADRGNHQIQLTARFEALRERFAELFGEGVLAALGGGQTIAQLISQVGAPQEVIPQLDIMLQVGMVLLEEQEPLPQAPPAAGAGATPPAAQTQAPAGTPALPLEQLAQPTSERPTSELRLTQAPADEPSPALDPQPQPTTELRLISPQALPGETSPRELVDEDSEVIHLSQTRAPLPQTRGVDPAQIKVALQLIQSTYLGLHDASPYRVLGVAPQSDPSSIEVAYQVKRKQFDLGNFQQMDLGEHYAHIKEINAALDEAFATLSDPARREAYNQSLTLGDASQGRRQRSKALQAEELCHRGEELILRGDFAEAAQALAKAVQIDPQAEYHALQAFALFHTQQGLPQAADRALDQLQAALALDAANTTVYWVMARLLRALGQQQKALAALRQLIKLDPGHQEAFAELELLLREQGQLETLEAEYRRTIHLASQQDPHWTGLLWQRLALLYREELGDLERARLACETALRLLPRNQELLQLLVELDQQDPERWDEALLGYRALLRAQPGQPQPVHQLFELHQRGARVDAACTAASVAVALGWATPEEEAFYQQHRRQSLQRVTRPLEPAIWQQLRHADDDPGLGALFETLDPLLRELHPSRPEARDITASNLLEPSVMPRAFAELLAYVARTLGSPLPPVALDASLAGDVQLIDCASPTLLVGPAALSGQDPLSLCFRLGWALSMNQPGRAIAGCYSRQVLRGGIYAALAHAFPKLDLPDPSDEASAMRQLLANRPSQKKTVVEIAISLQRRLDRLCLSTWQRGIQLSGQRLGLLLCGDLPAAWPALADQEPATRMALIDFALSKTYGELRQRLGLALSPDPSA